MKKLRKASARAVKYSILLHLWLFAVAPSVYAQAPMQAQPSTEKIEDDEGETLPSTDLSQSDSANIDDGGGALEPNGWNGLFGIVEAQLTNGLLHAGIRIAGTEFAKSSLATIKRNVTEPWQALDQSLFRTNMLGHPYQGAFYFQAARSNNWGFYASTANAVLGSFVWEIFGERSVPSMNDVITTPLGGAVFGEALRRLYYSAESLSGVMPGILRFILSPFDFINPYLPGGNPPAKPNGELWQLDASAGLFFGAQSRVNPTGAGFGHEIAPGASLALNAVYGNPFATYVPWSDPFRQFELSIAIDGSYPVYQVGIFAHGMLYAYDYATKKTIGVAGLSLHYDALYGAAVSFGGTSLDFTLTNRRPLPFGDIDFKLHAGALLFGSANTFNAEADLSGWKNDEIQVYGSGANLKFSIGINGTSAGDFAFSSAFYFMPLYYDRDGYANWGEMVFFWMPSFSYSFRVTQSLTLSASFSDAFCVELFNEKQDIIENIAVIRIAAGYRFRAGEKR